MSSKKVKTQELYDNINPFLRQYTDLAYEAEGSKQKILDDILSIQERYNKSVEINQGGMKKILKTTDSVTKRPVAKAILIESDDVRKTENFLREARLTAALEHPNIIPIYDIGVEDDGRPYFIMKLVGGTNLSKILKTLSDSKDNTDFSLQSLMEIFLKVCDAVAYAHSKGILHLDLKPENIQIGDYGEVLVCDWGLAKVLDQPEDVIGFDLELDPYAYNDVTLDGFIKGTPGYMAPEQIDISLGSKDKRTDIYALGGILYSILTLRAPFESDTVDEILMGTVTGEIIPPSQRVQQNRYVPLSLEAVAMKALEIEAERRYQTVSELRMEINKWMGGFATEAENAGFAKSLFLLLKRHKIVSSLLLILFFSAIWAAYIIKQNERRAVLSENESKKTLALYVKEKELKGQIGAVAIDQTIRNVELAIDLSEFEKAADLTRNTLQYLPQNEKLNALMGEIDFYCQDYQSSINYLNKAGSFKNEFPCNLMLKLAPEYSKLMKGKDYLKASDLIDLISSFQQGLTFREAMSQGNEMPTDKKYSIERIFNYEAHKFSLESQKHSFKDFLEDLPRLKNHLEFCRLMLLKNNDMLISLNFKYRLDEGGIDLDLSNCKGYLYGLRHLKHLPLKSLNLEGNPSFHHTWILFHYWLKSVNIKNTAIVKLLHTEIRSTNLKEIILSQEQFDNSEIPLQRQKAINFIIK